MSIPPSKEEARARIAALVARFREQRASYLRADYNETQVRRDFIDPFFKALGWDMDNSAGNAEAYREVIHEDRVKVGKAVKAPDYSFRLEGGRRGRVRAADDRRSRSRDPSTDSRLKP